jgi:hypothetical protein
MKFLNQALVLSFLIINKVLGSPIIESLNETISLRERRNVGLPLPVCINGFSADGSGNFICNGDSSGNRRQATEVLHH